MRLRTPLLQTATPRAAAIAVASSTRLSSSSAGTAPGLQTPRAGKPEWFHSHWESRESVTHLPAPTTPRLQMEQNGPPSAKPVYTTDLIQIWGFVAFVLG